MEGATDRGRRARRRANAILAEDEAIVARTRAKVARRKAIVARKEAQRIGLELRHELTQVLSPILEDRVGQQLDAREERVFHQLAARLATPDRQTYVAGLQVCERCNIVFRTGQRNARRCASCRRKRARKIRPAHLGGAHLATYGDPAAGGPLYLGRCEECGHQFTSRDVRQRLCAEHGTNAARQRRFRARSREPG
jgi:hypothetical protein